MLANPCRFDVAILTDPDRHCISPQLIEGIPIILTVETTALYKHARTGVVMLYPVPLAIV